MNNVKTEYIYKDCDLMKEAYINCLIKLELLEKNLKTDNDIKRGKLYFTWIKDKAFT